MFDAAAPLSFDGLSPAEVAVKLIAAGYALWGAAIALWVTGKNTIRAGIAAGRTAAAASRATLAWARRPSRLALAQLQQTDLVQRQLDCMQKSLAVLTRGTPPASIVTDDTGRTYPAAAPASEVPARCESAARTQKPRSY